VRFAIRVTPRAGRDRIESVADGALGVRVSAAPADGAANAAVLRLLAAELGVAPSRLRLVSGAAGRHKLVEVAGLEPAELRARWPGLGV
jgi:uncharacterized protein YggU (UPF0235/DUF167 family)